MAHQPVLFSESLSALAIHSGGVYVDGTFGRGGHSQGILDLLGGAGRLFAFDKDPEAISYAEKTIQDDRFTLIPGSFSRLLSVLEGQNLIGNVSGLFLDLGVSSPQLDQGERGFSFMRDGPLDMRMDPQSGQSAAQWLATVSLQELMNVLWRGGEERFAKPIARAICCARDVEEITRTQQLARIISDAHPRWPKGKHPATQSFQAIRIEINQELHDLRLFLDDCLAALKPGGRLAIISFHSLEDQIVKRFIRHQARGGNIPREVPVRADELEIALRPVGKAIRASQAEIDVNPRARSAVLRVAEKL